MKKIYPKECINNNCNKLVYVEKHNLHLPLQCESCINKKKKMNNKRPLTLAIDFDGTIAEEAFPGIGKLRPEADKYINMLYDQGCNILIFTCRTGSYEGDAENFLRRKGIKYHYINSNMPSAIEFFGSDCRKLSADIYIDDKSILGLPPTWKEIYEIVQLKLKKHETV